MTEKFFKMMRLVEKSYRKFSVLRHGEFLDRLAFVLAFVFGAFSIGYIYCAFTLTDADINPIVAISFFVVTFLFVYGVIQRCRCRESFLTFGGKSLEDYAYEHFLSNLYRNGVDLSTSNILIIKRYFEERLRKMKMIKTHDFVLYFAIFVTPVILTLMFTLELKIYLFVCIIVSVGIIPGFCMYYAFFSGKKKIMYINIIHFLNLYLQIKDFEKIENSNQ